MRRAQAASAALLRWYEPRRCAYPWRVRPTPYRVLVSEIMLQQTQAARVAPAFERFVAAFPSVRSLARASPGDVLRAWDGLGYNRRAIALSRAAGQIVARHGGRVPRDTAALRELPGVGPYTADAVAALAFAQPRVALDVNVRRVAARVLLGTEPPDVAPARLADAARRWLGRADPADWNQALMDLGREVCRPAPRCDACPLRPSCGYAGAVRLSMPRNLRPQPQFRGSMRQVRGGVVRCLRAGSPASLRTLAGGTGQSLERVSGAVRALHEEGVVHAGPGALEGRPRGLVSLPK